MALSDYIYLDGTISVTANQKGFTGSGTAWLLRGAVGAIVIVGGVLNVVSTITAENAGQFMDNWSGPTLANVPYKMWLVTAEAATNLANHYRLAQIIASIDSAQPANKNLSGLADLASVADTLGYFIDNQGHMDLVAFKAWARSFIGASDIAAARASLGAQAALGYTPVQNGTGTGQNPSVLAKIGWDATALNLRAQVDAVDLGMVWTNYTSAFSKTGNGYCKLPNGLILQWGVSTNAATEYTIAFLLAFPAYCAHVSLINTYAIAGSQFIGVSTSNISKTNFDVRGRNIISGSVAAVGTVPVTWFAIGF